MSALEPCLTEDQTAPDCYWDAQTQGNGIGEDFVVFDGIVHYTYVDAGDDYTGGFIPSKPVEYVTEAPAPILDTLPATGLDFDPSIAFGIGILLVAVGILAARGWTKIPKLGKNRSKS